ncbi:MAG: TonB-dependent receptor, partial [Pseudomonadales bacterium]
MLPMLKIPAFSTLVMALTAFQVPVFAASSENATLEEVVVTARRRAENLQDVPMAVTAFSGEELSQRGATDITEIAEVTPSMTLEPSRATNSTLTAFIRGVGQQDPLAGFEQGVALYLDDVYVARPQGALLDIYDVERIEVLRGPQGTLYGRNAVGGAIKYVTRKLGHEPGFRAKTQFGSDSMANLILTASTPVSDSLAIGATVASLNRDGYGRNLTTGAENYNKDVFAYRLSAEFAPTDDLFIRLAYDHTEDDSDPVAGFRPFPGGASGDPVLPDLRDTTAGASQAISTAGINGKNKVESEGIHLSIEWSLGDDLTLRSITAQREDYTLSVIDFDSLASMDFDAPVIYDNEQFSQEFQLLFNTDRLSLVTGVYYLDATASNDFDVVLGLLHPLGITAYTGGVVDTKAWSIFADATFDFTDRISVSLGGRYTDDDRKADIFRANYLGFGSPFFGNDTAFQIAVTSDYL